MIFTDYLSAIQVLSEISILLMVKKPGFLKIFRQITSFKDVIKLWDLPLGLIYLTSNPILTGKSHYPLFN